MRAMARSAPRITSSGNLRLLPLIVCVLYWRRSSAYTPCGSSLGTLGSAAGAVCVPGVVCDGWVWGGAGAGGCALRQRTEAAVSDAVVPRTKSLVPRCTVCCGSPNWTAVVKRVTHALSASPSANMWARASTDRTRMW